MVVRRPGKIIEINADTEYVRLYTVSQQDHTDVIVMTVVNNAAEYGFMQVDDREVVSTSKEDVEMIIRSLLRGNVTKRNDIVYYDELDGWLLYYFRGENVVFATGDDYVYALGSAEGAVNAAAEVDEKLRELVASFVSQLPL